MSSYSALHVHTGGRARDSPQAGRAARHSSPSFASPEGLRTVLIRLHEAGDGAWRSDPEARELMLFAIDRYRRLARSWHRDPAETGATAFLTMRAGSVLRARDPWAVVTASVRRTLASETSAERLLTSPSKLGPATDTAPPPLRLGDRAELLEYAAADHAFAGQDDLEREDEPSLVADALAGLGWLLVELGWPAKATAVSVEYIVSRVEGAGSIRAAYELLRREVEMAVRFGLPAQLWPGLLRAVLGPRPVAGVPQRPGLLVRLLSGEPTDRLLSDAAVVMRASPGPEMQAQSVAVTQELPTACGSEIPAVPCGSGKPAGPRVPGADSSRASRTSATSPANSGQRWECVAETATAVRAC